MLLVVLAGVFLLPFIYRSELKAKKKENEKFEDENIQNNSQPKVWQFPDGQSDISPNKEAAENKTKHS